MLSSAATPREPSAFMTTAFQLPSSGSHSSVCSPAPVAEAAQKVWSAGRPSGAPPGRSEYSGSSSDLRDDGALDSVEVLGDVRLAGDADEHRTFALAADTNRPQEVRRRPVGPVEVDVGALGGDRVRRRREVLGRRHEEAVVVALGAVDDDGGASTGEQGERQQRRDAAHDEQRHASRASPAARRASTASVAGEGAVGASTASGFRRLLLAALVETERRVGVGHQPRVRDDPRDPAVEAEHEIEDRPAGTAP